MITWTPKLRLVPTTLELFVQLQSVLPWLVAKNYHCALILKSFSCKQRFIKSTVSFHIIFSLCWYLSYLAKLLNVHHFGKNLLPNQLLHIWVSFPFWGPVLLENFFLWNASVLATQNNQKLEKYVYFIFCLDQLIGARTVSSWMFFLCYLV